MQTERLNFQVIELNGEVIFKEVSLADNLGLTQENLKEIIDAFQNRLVNQAQTALFIPGSRTDYYSMVFSVIQTFPRLQYCILRIGTDIVWLPMRVYFKGDARLN